jgi:hypothetical protein
VSNKLRVKIADLNPLSLIVGFIYREYRFSGKTSSMISFPVSPLRRSLVRTIAAFLLSLWLLGLAPSRPSAAQNGNSGIQELKQRQKQERRVLKLQQKSMKRAVKGRGYTRAERKRMERQMKSERKLLQRGQRDQMLSAKEQQKMDKKNGAGSLF